MHSKVWARPGSTDLYVFEQIFIQREYQPLEDLPGVVSILDLGANVGYSSRFLLDAFPDARVVSVEPDPQNFEMLRRNLEPLGGRATAVRGGAWNRCGHLAVSPVVYRGGGASCRQVEPAAADAFGAFPSFDVPALMAMAGFPRISLLKVDIEGAEAVVFDESSSAWIDLVDSIAIELHDDTSFGPASPVFWQAVRDRGFAFSRSGELVLCRRA